MGKTVNRQELADIFGYSLPTISAWVENGMPVKSHGGRGKQFEFDTEDVLKWLLARERAERKAHTAATLKEGGEEITIDKARLRNEIAKAKLSELELATKMELVRPIQMIVRVLSNEIANARARLLGIPSKLRPAIQLEVGAPEGTKKLVNEVERLILEALNEIKMTTEPVEEEPHVEPPVEHIEQDEEENDE
ncbi:phage terminase Nu1 subunit (DNA packaging protein) [Bradyrhizobium japonicum]|uniref:Phage terminase Nu1 subunit (DNA packaging protein) n=2 Tax=Bradyrhizobium TaxID=374 RepID=A0A562QS49_9BRAD|nr:MULTISPECIES: terminase small subunit [Bradyrhizobium]WLB95720.1 terminase small subunit [Bradyrhizobium japonicum USDA 123]MBR0883721.1 terminase small subunit [Bradyrhizobium liaoningense]MBR1003901.1 terminase small subunit [Bradyrhizobium liaoningense]MBR1070569.1 terminase small subunit [Bradyrhizobium liaoningense]MCP1738579.1 phage terminase Nu1 subunit (DNA packaging protein) [Bradyrhizobium japonicum]